MIYGERKTESNETEVNNVPVEIIKDNKKRLKKITTISILIIVLLVFSFLLYYFVTTYKSIKVYRINSNEEEYTMDEGIIITSREKVYMKIGNVKDKDDKNIKAIRLFYKNKKGEKELYYYVYDQLEDSSTILTYDFGKEEIFPYSDIPYIIKSLTIEVTFEDNERDEIKLNISQDFINNKIITDYSLNNSKKENTINNHENIPSYFIENFEYIPEEEKYVRDREENEYEIEEVYCLEKSIYTVTEKNEETINYFEYHLENGSLTYSKMIKNINKENFTIILKNNECIYGSCENRVIDYFRDNYIKNISNQ